MPPAPVYRRVGAFLYCVAISKFFEGSPQFVKAASFILHLLRKAMRSAVLNISILGHTAHFPGINIGKF